jgi:hypothetical protein
MCEMGPGPLHTHRRGRRPIREKRVRGGSKKVFFESQFPNKFVNFILIVVKNKSTNLCGSCRLHNDL